MKKLLVPLIVLLVTVPTALAQGIVILTSDNIADLPAAQALANAKDADIVVTEWGTFNATALAQITAKAPSQVFIIGGEVAIPPAAEEQLNALDIQTKRLAGIDRYETAVKIAEEFEDVTEVIIAQGDDEEGAKQALNRSRKGVPILYIKPDRIPPSVKAKLQDLRVGIRLIPAPNLNKTKIGREINETGSEIVEEIRVNLEQRALAAIAEAEEALTEAREVLGNETTGRNLAAARLIMLAEIRLVDATIALDVGDYGRAFGQATAAKHLARNAQRIAKNIVVGYLREHVDMAEEEIGMIGEEIAGMEIRESKRPFIIPREMREMGRGPP